MNNSELDLIFFSIIMIALTSEPILVNVVNTIDSHNRIMFLNHYLFFNWMEIKQNVCAKKDESKTDNHIKQIL